MELDPAAGEGLPACPAHLGSLVRRYRAYGPNGPGVYPQCVPGDDEPHLLAWEDLSKTSATCGEPSGLSLTELGVLDDAMRGMTVSESAANRSKGPETVKTQRKAILLKLGARNMAQAVGIAVREKLVERGAP
jgi:DNA-binding CsgD family transcriptional regulator